MNTMKKFWTIICSFAFVVALSFGVVLNTDRLTTTASAASSAPSGVTLINDGRACKVDVWHTDDYMWNAHSAKTIYLDVENNALITGATWSTPYKAYGDSVKLNGETITPNFVNGDWSGTTRACLDNIYATSVGDMLTIDGWFSNGTNAFCVEEVSFIFDGSKWEKGGTTYMPTVSSTGSASEIYFTVPENNIPVCPADELSGTWSYNTKPYTPNSKVMFNGESLGVNFKKFSADSWYLDLGKEATNGTVVTIGGWYYCPVVKVNSNGDWYETDEIYYIKISPTTFTWNGITWTQYTPSISVSFNGEALESNYLYVMPGETANITATADNGNAVSTVYENGAVEDGKFVLRAGESTSEYLVAFSVSDGNRVYRKEMIVRVGLDDFVMEEGAAVRVAGEEVNGLRFTAELSEETYNSLSAQDATFGMVIVPRDYITAGYELTSANLFGASAVYSETAQVGVSQAVRRMSVVKNVIPKDTDGDEKYEIQGAIGNINTSNLTREYVGVAYICVGDTYIVASYYGNDMENNARSMYYVAQRAITANDHASALNTKYITVFANYLSQNNATYPITYTINYTTTKNGKSITETEKVEGELNETLKVTAKEISGYTITSASSISTKLYANKANVFNFYYRDASVAPYDSMAWFYNSEEFETNPQATVEKMRDAGFTSVNLGFDMDLSSGGYNYETVKDVIHKFWEYGNMRSVVYIWNSGAEERYTSNALPDFKNCGVCKDGEGNSVACEAFAGFQVWDEPAPTSAIMNRIAEYAQWYNSIYGADEKYTFMANLYPSYYGKWSSGEYKSYAAYIQAYIDTVLSQVTGTKYLSMDSYPINSDGTLGDTFLYDLAILKAKAVANSSNSSKIVTNAILQACGFGTGEHMVAPTEEEFRLQLYTALAFGMDSVSWWGYTTPGTVIVQDQTADANSTVYNSIKAVNAELASFGSLYAAYDWKGVIMSSPSKGWFSKDPQYEAFNKVKSDSTFSNYLLSASNTSSFSSISGSGSNHIIGVMEDDNGNEAFAIVNYAAIDDNKTLNLTLNGNASGTYNIYTADGVKTVTIGTGGYTLTLTPGSGAFIVSATTQHTVTFKNWDGTILQTGTYVYGETVSYTGATPEKAGAQFIGWTPTFESTVKGDAVYTAAFNESRTITYINKDGTATEYTDTVNNGEILNAPETPTLDGYIFKEWQTLDGETYAFGTAITEDITLVATWKALGDPGEKATMSATDVLNGVTRDAGYISATAKANPSASWYFDSDYIVDWQGTTERQLATMIEFGVTVDGGAGTSSTAVTRTIELPKINYTQYAKVDFGYTISVSSSVLKLNGTAVPTTGNKLVSVITDSTGTYVIVREVNAADYNVKIDNLSQDVINGKAGLTFTIDITKYNAFNLTEFHMTEGGYVDYQAKMDAAVEVVNDSQDENEIAAAVAEYDKYSAYRTTYEKSFGEPAVITAARQRTITFVNGDGTAATTTQKVNIGETVSEPTAPTLDGYVFMGWTLNGEIYDFSTSISGNMTLVAKWSKLVESGEKSVILTADDVKDGTTWANGSERSVGEDAQNVTGLGWTYDTDYFVNGGAMSLDNLLNKYAKFVNKTSGTQTITLPKLNYSLYAKVDFAYQMSGGTFTDVTVGGATDSGYSDGVKRVVNITPDSNGVYWVKIYQENANNVLASAKLSDAVVNGTEALTISFGIETTYMWLRVTKFHGTSRVLDYQAKMAEAVETLSNASTEDEKAAALAEYNKYAAYRTEYEASLGDPDAVTAVKESVYYNAIIDATNGSQDQYEAIAAYRAYCDTLSDTEKANATHQTNVAAVNAIIEEYFYETTESAVTSVATLSTNAGSESNVAINSSSKFNDTTKYPYTTFSYSNGNTASATFTLNAFNYAAYDEVYFGIAYAMTDATARSISIAGATYADSWNGYVYRMKAVISNGYLTLYEDGTDSRVETLETYLQVQLSDAVLNGTEGLVIEFTQGDSAYAWLEVTNTIAVADVKRVS